MTTSLRCAPLAITIALCLGTAAPAQAADEASAAARSCRPLTNLQQRIVDKSKLGVADVRRFVERTRMIYEISMLDVAESLDAWRAAASCGKQVADATPMQR